MGPNSGRETDSRLPAATYWRRRFLALVAGMAVLALVAWAFSGALGPSRAATDQPPRKPHASTSPVVSPTASASSPAPSPSPSPTPSATKHPAKGNSHTGKTDSAHKGHKTGNERGLPCPAGAVVLSLFSSQGSYARGQEPQFQIDVVSTASQSCTFDIGAGHVVLRISRGTKTVWTSAECAEGAASLVATLARGVPTIVPMTWNGRRSSPGCPVPGAQAPDGSYSAVAADGSLHSSSVTFRLG